MSIFRRDPDPPQPTPPVQRPAAPPAKPQREAVTPPASSPDTTRIAVGSKLVGEITGKASLVVQGEIEGAIQLDGRVEIGTDGRVNGSVEAVAVQVGGRVLGDVIGRERVEVLASGRLEGDVSAPRITIADGAFVKGKIEMSDKPAPAKQTPAGGADKSNKPSETRPAGAPKPPRPEEPSKGGKAGR